MQRQDGVHQGLGAGRATGGVDIDRHDLIDALDNGVVVEHPAARRAHAHGNDPLGLHHLVVDLAQDGSHLLGHPAGHDHQVGLTRRGPEDLHAVASQVVVGSTGGHHLNGAARQAERRRPATPGPRPLHEVLDLGRDEVVLETLEAVGHHVGGLADSGKVHHQAARSRPSSPTSRTPARRTVDDEVRCGDTAWRTRRTGPHSRAPLPIR